MMGSAIPQPFRGVPMSDVGPTPSNLILTAASLRLGRHLSHRLRLRFRFLVHSSFKKLCHLSDMPRLKDVWCERAAQFKEINIFQFKNDALASLCLFDGGDRKDPRNDGTSHLDTSRRNSFYRRKWTNVLLALNVVIYITQVATQGKLLLWGAKINSLIDKGQFWRLFTSSFLHANIGHLMVNCYSLNSVGPTMENISGPKRYLLVYFTSAIASSAMSYWYCKAPAVGASGAIFGLVGSVAVFVMRHRGMVRGGREDLQHIAQVIFLNMVIGVLSKGIDNWGHLGGLLGGAATSWLLGPVWKYESTSIDGRRVFVDKPPIFFLINRKRKPSQLK